MHQDLFRSAANHAGPVPQLPTLPKPDIFERVPINLSDDEIRAMVRELLG